MRDVNQKMRFNSVELSLMKGVFAENEAIQFAVRKVMLQVPLEANEIVMIQSAMTAEVLLLMRKIFLPVIDGDSPFFQLTTMLLSLGADTKDKDPDQAWPYIRAKDLEIDYIEQQLDVLADMSKAGHEKIKLNNMINLKVKKTEREDALVGVMAFNYLLSFFDSHIFQVKQLAGLKEETVEATLERLAQDSNK